MGGKKFIRCMHYNCLNDASEVVGAVDTTQCVGMHGHTHDCCGEHPQEKIR